MALVTRVCEQTSTIGSKMPQLTLIEATLLSVGADPKLLDQDEILQIEEGEARQTMGRASVSFGTLRSSVPRVPFCSDGAKVR